MNVLKNKKGSITLFILVSMLFFVLLLAGMYMLSSSKEQTGISQTSKIKEIYEKDVNQVDNVYETLAKELVYYVEDIQGNEIPVPKGFSPILTQDQGTKYTGFVIKNDEDGNEFVWVPVQAMEYTYDRVAWVRDDWSKSQVLDETTKQIKQDYYHTEILSEYEKTSIEKYGGYYIGRYESGKDSNNNIVIQKDQTVYNNVNCTDAKNKAENLYTKDQDNVVSKLCSSYAWDTALKFIETQNSNYPTNSVGGNYSGSLLDTGYDVVHPCNIYDMGGNVSEWTTETCISSDIYTSRSGNYNHTASEYPAAFRHHNGNDTLEYIGFRITLYL